VSQMQPIGSVLDEQKDELAVLQKLTAKIFVHGAILSCAVCGRTKEKTSDEMAPYLKKWPRCCKTLVNVRTK
jgi:hypothetical protein